MRVKISSVAVFLAVAFASAGFGQSVEIGKLEGRASTGKVLYRRYCIGCHGPEGDGNGENAAWIDPKPRDFTAAVFKCRSTPTGTLPTDQDLFDAITRGFVTTNMPPWKPLTNQNRADLVAYVKTFSARWEEEKPGPAIAIPPEPPITIAGILHGRELFNFSGKTTAGNATARKDTETGLRLRRSPIPKTIRFGRTTLRQVPGSSAASRTRISIAYS